MWYSHKLDTKYVLESYSDILWYSSLTIIDKLYYKDSLQFIFKKNISLLIF